MGVGYYRNITTWHYGTNTYACNYYQDDLAIVSDTTTNGFGLRTDDIGNTHTLATSVGFTSTGFNTTGLINSGADKDVFKFTLTNLNLYSPECHSAKRRRKRLEQFRR